MTDLFCPGKPVAAGRRARRPLVRPCVTLVLVAGVAGVVSASSAAQPAPETAIGVDVTITHTRLASDGRAVPSSGLPTTFRLERVHDESGWRTVLTYRAVSPQNRTRASENPLNGARIEYADGATGIRVFDTSGRLNTRLSPPGAEGHSLPVFDGMQRWLDTLIADPQRREERRHELVRQYGRPEGRVRQMDRYRSRRGDTEDEILADPRSGLVVEARQTRRGVLEHQTTFDYQVLPDGRYARRTIRSESRLGEPEEPSGRAVLAVAFANLTIGGRQ